MEAEPNKPSPTELAAAIGVSTPYASQLLSGVRIPPVPTAIKVFRAIGLKLGPIQGASDDEIDVLSRFQTGRPPDAYSSQRFTGQCRWCGRIVSTSMEASELLSRRYLSPRTVATRSRS
jgi:transcriptional regulator with XRE-family HTH domain